MDVSEVVNRLRKGQVHECTGSFEARNILETGSWWEEKQPY